MSLSAPVAYMRWISPRGLRCRGRGVADGRRRPARRLQEPADLAAIAAGLLQSQDALAKGRAMRALRNAPVGCDRASTRAGARSPAFTQVPAATPQWGETSTLDVDPKGRRLHVSSPRETIGSSVLATLRLR